MGSILTVSYLNRTTKNYNHKLYILGYAMCSRSMALTDLLVKRDYKCNVNVSGNVREKLN